MNDAVAIFIISSVYIGKYDQKPSANVKFSLSAHVTIKCWMEMWYYNDVRDFIICKRIGSM